MVVAFHQPVLLEACLQGLAINDQGIYVDLTFGAGGHTRAILARLTERGRLLALDRDDWAQAEAQKIADPRFRFALRSFDQLEETLIEYADFLGGQKVSGILMDLGVSSMQLDNAERGFSFMRDGPLDMRMDRRQTQTAADWIHNAPENELIRVIRQYGEERFAAPIGRAIVRARAQTPIMRTLQLAQLIEKAMPAKARVSGKHPATRTFQAIRIHLNGELTMLTQTLSQCHRALAIGGRLAVISFHSLEDRIVKHFVTQEKRHAETLIASLPRGAPVNVSTLSGMRTVGKKIRPDDQECLANPRARSATLRIAEKY